MGLARILLTGAPGVGKTTLARTIARKFPRSLGFVTEEVRVRGRRTGFRVIDLGGRGAPLAELGGSGRFRIGRYVVDLASFEAVGVAALRRAIDSRAPLVVVDEIGKMEPLSEAFRVEVLRALTIPVPFLGVVPEATDLPFVEALRSRPELQVIEVTRANRESLVKEVVAILRGKVPRAARAQLPRAPVASRASAPSLARGSAG